MARSEPEYGVVLSRDVMVPMRDGVRLAMDIYRPAGADGEPLPGPFPTVLGRTSYGKATEFMWVDPVANFFTPRGFVVCVQDLRGRGGSEGTGQYFHVANPLDGDDGYDTVEWIADRPWSNGKVGMVGSSHGAMVQTTAALKSPPHLTTIWPDVGPIRNFFHHMREGGAMALHMFGAQFLHAHDAQELRDDPSARALIHESMHDLRAWVFRTPFKPGHTPLRVVPGLEQTLFNYYYRGTYDEWWAAEFNDYEAHFAQHADIPGVFSGGWYDPYSIATTTHFMKMAAQNTTPQRLLMGPWTHDSMRQNSSASGDVDFGEPARWGNVVYNEHRLRWLDRWLKGDENGVDDDPPVRIFVMGGGDGHKTPDGKLFHGGAWRDEQEWPLARAMQTTFYLHTDGSLTEDTPATDAAPRRYTHDPSHPVPTVAAPVTGFFEMVRLSDQLDPFLADRVPGRLRMKSIVLPGAADQRESPEIVGAQPPYPTLAARPDVLVFQTELLEEAVEITGPMTVKLWVSSSAVDTDFTAKLIDVYPRSLDYPDGYAMNLVDSIMRVRYRDSWEHETFMTPGEVYEIVIALPPTSNVFAKGHRIRLDISSSNFPRYDLNPGTGEPMGRHTHNVVAHNAIYLDHDHPSQITVPVIPASPASQP